MKALCMATTLVLVMLSGCATPGNLKGDLVQIDAALAGKQQSSRVAIKFTNAPGTVSGSTEMFAGGAYIKGGKRLDTKAISEETVALVFGKLFSDTELVRTYTPSASGLYVLTLQAESGTSEWDGTHTATVNAQFYGPDDNLLLEKKVCHVVDHIQYAREAPMRRAYLRAFADLALQIHDRLVGASASSRAQYAELMSTACPNK